MSEQEHEPIVKDTVEHPEHVGETEATPAPVRPAESHDDLRETVSSLSTKVDELSSLVMGLAPAQQDTKPTRKPWTHWGNK